MSPAAEQLTLTALGGVPAIQPGDDLAAAALAALGRAAIQPQAGDVLVLAQKIVSKAEGRLVRLDDVTPSPEARSLAATTGKDPRLVELILSESAAVLRAVPGVLIVEHRLGMVMANAGIDQSNLGPGHEGEAALLLPIDPDGSCRQIRTAIRGRTGVDIAVMVIDSVGRAWRNGVVGLAIGVAGLPALMDLRGRADLFGRILRASEVAVADELAAAASLVMGQADEGRPMVLARGAPYGRRDGSASELLRPAERDLFR